MKKCERSLCGGELHKFFLDVEHLVIGIDKQPAICYNNTIKRKK